ncbi:MAG TPA: ABC transporter permease [Acidimicrobiia bacterium]|jgi:spermidine/putrescine transport system permease protein|nr:ABC transporter permease [Acidimicrobiia bacterium]
MRNQWGKPRGLVLVTALYVLWSLIPVAIAIQFSFNAGRSRSTWQGFSTQWYVGDPEAASSVFYDPSLRSALNQSLKLAVLTMLVAAPLGVALAIGLARWRGRGAKPSNFLMLFPLVTPEIVMGVALFLVFDNLYDFVPFGTWAQFLGHVTFSVSFVVIIVRGRLFAIGRDYEEAAMDLGASPWEAMRRVLLPLLTPALVASFAIVFALSIDDFVISQFLIGGANSVTIPVRLYSGARLAPPPSLNALATVLMVVTIGAVVVAGLGYKALTRRFGGDDSALETVGRFEI